MIATRHASATIRRLRQCAGGDAARRHEGLQAASSVEALQVILCVYLSHISAYRCAEAAPGLGMLAGAYPAGRSAAKSRSGKVSLNKSMAAPHSSCSSSGSPSDDTSTSSYGLRAVLQNAKLYDG